MEFFYLFSSNLDDLILPRTDESAKFTSETFLSPSTQALFLSARPGQSKEKLGVDRYLESRNLEDF